MISNRCARKSLLINCNLIISKNYLQFLVDSNDSLLEKIKNVDWKEKGNKLYEKLKPYAKKVDRTVAKSMLHFILYYLMIKQQHWIKY